MDGVSRASGAAYIVVTLPKCFRGHGEPNGSEDGFDEFKWPPIRVEDFAVVENHLLKNRVSPIDAVLPELERLASIKTQGARRLAKALEQQAYRDLRKSKAQNKISLDEMQDFIDNPEGLLFTMRICLQRLHPTISDYDVRRIFDWLGEQEAKRLRDIAQGSDRLGNSTGPTRETAGERATVEASTGDGSTAGSPPNTAGTPAG